jgi:hypothetical protein
VSTRGVIARATGEGKFVGRYHHSDSNPTDLGVTLWNLYHGFFRRDLPKMLAYLVDAPHAVCGWSTIVDKDFRLKPGYTLQKAIADGAKYEVYSKRPDYMRPQCFAGRPGETEDTRTEKDLQDTDCEWLYAFDVERQRVFVRDLNHKEDVAVIDLDGPEPDWTKVECGENLERCHHLAWVHNLTPKTSNLSTQTWLGKRPLGLHDAVAVEVGGKTLKLTGSGGDADFYNRTHRGPFPSGTYVASCVHKNGHRVELPIAKRIANDYQPLPDVVWIFPPTKDQPATRKVAAEQAGA